MREVELGSVARFVRGVTFKPSDVTTVGRADTVACMRTTNVQERLDTSDIWHIPRVVVKRSDQYLLAGDILVSSANSWNLVGKCCWVPELPEEATFGGFVSALRVDSTELDPRYAYHWFSSPRTQRLVRSFGRQTTNISNLDQARCLRMTVPVPPLDEQKRIARVLDAAELIRARRRESTVVIERLVESVFIRWFIRSAANGFPSRPIAEVCETSSGGTPSRAIAANYGGDISWIKSGELHGGVVTASEERITETGLRSSSAKLLGPGTVLVAMYGATAGVVAELGMEAATNQAICALVPTEATRGPFLLWALRASMPHLMQRRVGGAQPNLTQAAIREHLVPVPPIDMQDRFAGVHRATQGLRRRSQKHLAQLDALFGSLQHRAFIGEL